MNTIDERLRSILNTFEIDARLIPEEALFCDDLGMPFGQLSKLVRKIERDFDVKAPQQARQKWNSIASIRSYLHNHIH
ncbi:MAG: acyl carrier protein [Cytophagales bacterium]|nr:acyl carrier protein [Cytophagales bacterium]